LNVKCVFGKNLRKTPHNLRVSKERLTADEEQSPSHSLIALHLFSYFLSFSCFILLSAVHCAAKQATESTGQCSPWRSTPWCGQSCRSYRGCVHPRGSSLGCLLQTGDHHNPRKMKTDRNNISKNVKYLCEVQIPGLCSQGLHNVATSTFSASYNINPLHPCPKETAQYILN
jgi:hypothetical protein